MAHCINIKSKEFKDLVELTGQHPLDLAVAISTWQDDNNTDEFPTKELIKKLDREKVGYRLKQISELFESNPELANQVYEALGFNKNLGKAKVISKTTAKEILNSFDGGMRENFKNIINELLKIPAFAERTVNYIERPIGNPMGFYDSLNDFLGLDVLSKNETKAQQARAIVEEVIHSLTSRPFKISKGLMDGNLTQAEKDFIDNISNLRKEVLRQRPQNAKDYYGLSSDEEFIARAFIDEPFQEYLSRIEIKRTNVFSKIIDYIKQLLASYVTVKDNSALQEVLGLTEEFISKQQIAPQQKQQAQQLYSQYLDSKGYKNIYYHYSVSNKKFDKFSKEKIGTANLRNTSGIDTVSLVDNFKLAQAFGQFGLDVYSMKAEDVESFSDEYAKAHNKNIVFVGINNNTINKGKVFKTPLANGFEINVENLDALDVLGSKQDIEGFKEFIESEPKTEFKLFQAEKKEVTDINKLGKKFNVNVSGFFIKNINLGDLIREATKLGLKVEETSNKNGYYLTQNGRKINPYYQESVDKGLKKISKASEEQIISKVKAFLQAAGITYINVENIKDAEGNVLSANAVAKLAAKVIEVVEGKGDVTTLTEEAAHFFVAMIKDSQILEKMISDIDQYDVYKDVVNSEFYQEQYKGNDRMMRIEAVGKQIVKSIINSQPEANEKLDSKFKRFWNNIINKLKALFSKIDNKVKKDIFDIAGEELLAANTERLDAEKTITGELFQEKTDKQDEIVNNLDNKFNIKLNEEAINPKTGKKGVYELIKNGVITPIKNRVSDVVEEINKKRGFAERTPKQKAEDEVRRVIGIKGHGDINNIITRIVEEMSGLSTTQEVKNLNDKSYEELKKFFTDFIKEFPAGSKFYTEKTIYDEFKDEGGTIDLLVIEPDGKAHIFDWKFVEFKNKDSKGKILDKSVAWYKEENYNVQLTRYRQILRNYGIDKFGKTRIIPISAEYKNNQLSSIEIGNKKIDGLDKPYLEPVPISGLKESEIERTGDEKIDALLDVLLQQRRQITDKVEYTAEGKLKKAERLERINNSIKKLQIEGDIKAFLDDALFELNYIVNVGIKNLNNDDLVRAKALVDYYSDLKKREAISEEQSLKYKDVLARVTLNAQDLYAKVTKEYEARIEEAALKQGVDNIKELQPETGLLAKLFNTISQNNHPIVKTFYRLVMKQKDKVYKDTQELNKKIQKSLDALTEWGKTKGISGLDLFNGVLQFDKQGNKTGKLINRWNPEYYTAKKEAISQKDYKWFGENAWFDKKKYEEILAKNISVWTDMYKGEVDGDLKLQRRIEEYESKYNVEVSQLAVLNPSNRYIHPQEKWRSKEWKELQKPENKPLKDFYDLFTQTIDEFREHLPLDLNGNFIPNIKNDLLDQIMQNGMGTISGLGDSIIQHLRAESDASIGMIDEITGEKVKSIPLFYTKEIDAKTKSYDLGRVLSLFGNMAYNYKYMSEIESTSEMLKDVLSSQKQLITTSDGKKLKSQVTDKIATFVGSSDTLDQFNDFVNYYIYGIKTTGKNSTFNFLGNEVSKEKAISSVMKYYSTKALAFNLLPAAANLFGGQANAFFEGIKGRFYTNSDYRKGLSMMSAMNKKAFAAIEYFDIGGDETSFKKANKLSVSAVTKSMTMDKFHILQKSGDYTVENGVLLAMLQSHTIKDGKIVKKTKDETSLFDMMDTSDDKINIKGLSEEEFNKFRRKVKFLYSEMKGNSNADDISTIKLTVLGQAVMMFRGWIPRMANERFGDLKHVGDLETWEMGKYKSFIGQTLNKQIIPNILRTLASGGVLGIGAGAINSKSITQKAIELYNEAKAKNPDLKITQEEYIEMHKQNLRSAAMELQLILLLVALLLGLKGMDDDDEKNATRKAALKIVTRSLDELSFFVNPTSTMSILKKPVPILSLGTDITNFIGDFTGEGVGLITQDEERLKKNRPMRYFNKLFPVSNAIENFFDLLEK